MRMLYSAIQARKNVENLKSGQAGKKGGGSSKTAKASSSRKSVSSSKRK